MAVFIELTIDDAAGTKTMVNVDHIIGLVPETFVGTSKIMVPGAMIAIKESYEEVKAKLSGH